MGKYIAGVKAAETISEKTGIPLSDLVDIFAEIPAADVAPVVHWWWVGVDSSYWRWTPSGGVPIPHTTYSCERCGRGTVVKTHYCPNCGAKMDGGDNDAVD